MTTLSRDELFQAVFTSADHVHRRWTDYILERLSPEGLSLNQLAALYKIQNDAPIPSRDLARHLMVTAGAVTQIVDGLQAAGLVQRHADPKDRRVVNIALTDKGVELVGRIDAERKSVLVDVFAGFSDSELTALVIEQNKILQRLYELQKLPRH